MLFVAAERAFPLLAVAGALFAYSAPEALAGLTIAIVPMLGVVMFGMGMTLTGRDFLNVVHRPAVVLLGVTLQFMVMPVLGWLLSGLAGLSAGLAAGVILLGSCPGGTASNVICYLGKGDVALSITLTAVSTVLAVVATPVLTWLYVGERVPVPVSALLFSTVKIVLLPVLLGVVINRVLGARLGPLKRVFPLLSMLAIVGIIAVIVAANRAQIGQLAGPLLLVVLLHNAAGLAIGYLVPRVMGYGMTECRTLCIEVGMQNSGLAVALANQHFSALAALPGAVFSIWHNLSGSLLAGYWSRKARHRDG
jgi:BASS family bile acid:Na+ symporter